MSFHGGALAVTMAALPAALAAGACSPFASTRDVAPLDESGAEASDGSDAGRADGGGSPVAEELASDFAYATGIAATEDTVVLIETGKGRVLTLPIARPGAAFATLATPPRPTAVVVSREIVYWTDLYDGNLHAERIAGGPDTAVTIAAPDHNAGRALAATDAFLVVTATRDGTTRDDEIHQFSITSGVMPTNATIGGLANPYGVAVQGSKLYWTDSAGSGIGVADLGMTNARRLADGENDTRTVAANGRGVYWTLGTGEVRAKLDGQAVMTLAKGRPISIVADDSGVYWLDQDAKRGALYHSASGQPSDVEKLAGPYPLVFDSDRFKVIALTSTHVIWVTSEPGTGAGRLYRLRKPGR